MENASGNWVTYVACVESPFVLSFCSSLWYLSMVPCCNVYSATIYSLFSESRTVSSLLIPSGSPNSNSTPLVPVVG